MTHALVIRHHVEDDAGLIGDAFSARGWSMSTVMFDREHPTPALDDVDALVILGSNAAVYDPEVRAAWFERELDLLADAHARGLPILGICFGAQALCELAGGAVNKAAVGESGWHTIDVVAGRDLPAGPWFEYHGDECQLPPTATVWATSPAAVQAFTWGPHLGVQFHPEVDAEQLERWFDSENGAPRAHDDRQLEFLRQARDLASEARHRADVLVGLFLDHAETAISEVTQ